MPEATPRSAADLLKETVQQAVHRALNPEEARLREALRTAQIALAKCAAEHLPEIEAEGQHETAVPLLKRAMALRELADAIETTPVELVPSPRKSWDTPESQSFLGKLSQETARWLQQAGDKLRDTGERLEAGRCRVESETLYAEAGAILGSTYTVAAHYPSWAAEEIIKVRQTLEPLEAWLTEHAGETTTQQLHARMWDLHQQFGAVLNRENLHESFEKGGSQVRAAFIEFIAWGLRTFDSFALFIGLLSLSIFILPGWGAVLVAATIYCWAKWRPEIELKARKPPAPPAA